MRILLLAHGLPPDSVGGVEQHVDGLAKALVAAGHAVEVFAREAGAGRAQGSLRLVQEGNPRIVRAAYRWEGVRDLVSMYAAVPMAAALATFLAERAAAGVAFDVAHVHHLTGMSVGALAELRSRGVPVVLTLHDYWLMCPRGQMFHHREEACERVEAARCGECLQATFPWWLTAANRDDEAARVHAEARAVLTQANALVVPSARVVPPFVALGVARERFAVVENGVDEAALARLPAPAFAPGPLRLGYFGTVMPSKGLHVLLAALARLPRGTATLAIHGNVVPYHGDQSYGTRCFGALEPGAGVTYHGPYGLGELVARLAEIDVLAAPALWHEAFGLTVREALAAGRPALVSRIGGLQDAVVDGCQGLVLPPGDAVAWAAAITGLAADRAKLRLMSAQSRGAARSFDAMAADLLAVYRGVVAGPERAPFLTPGQPTT
jgi:glycosyltransferase involved in cell wall biosynthesis